ncbi:MAG: hypothetical protein V1847_00280 [Candidatus Diapherotrites archaeon]
MAHRKTRSWTPHGTLELGKDTLQNVQILNRTHRDTLQFGKDKTKFGGQRFEMARVSAVTHSTGALNWEKISNANKIFRSKHISMSAPDILGWTGKQWFQSEEKKHYVYIPIAGRYESVAVLHDALDAARRGSVSLTRKNLQKFQNDLNHYAQAVREGGINPKVASQFKIAYKFLTPRIEHLIKHPNELTLYMRLLQAK